MESVTAMQRTPSKPMKTPSLKGRRVSEFNSLMNFLDTQSMLEPSGEYASASMDDVRAGLMLVLLLPLSL
jgi:hypothetical protein